MLIRVIEYIWSSLNSFKLSLLLKVSFEDNLEQPRTVRAFYLFSSLLIDYMRVALI